MYKHSKQIITGGHPAASANAALIMIHGRGASAEDIMRIAAHLNVKDMALYAPQATNNSWYPYSFMSPVADNEPALTSTLELIGQTVEKAVTDGFGADNIYFMGFSQGACLTLEYIARNAKRFGGAVAFTGGLIGQELDITNYSGDFAGTPVLITTGDPDPHVPVSRVEESVEQLIKMNAKVTFKIYKERPHTVSFEELKLADQTIFI
ncbi:alpha/beta hydrolase [Mucilaginibacter glaciei]|uniref:Dienelactone hydrolase family protein n=1 Tax=Mucilaginibacter glaciei TaxID=2772109 RepID=A0A926NNG0_9SPHI|nr:dienelactone hydrolase family protein [Mucilaginibacter glaciei]MBD1391700.1 dienelactone hydrolase family protein [Mucilaginibacter glaciei]